MTAIENEGGIKKNRIYKEERKKEIERERKKERENTIELLKLHQSKHTFYYNLLQIGLRNSYCMNVKA